MGRSRVNRYAIAGTVGSIGYLMWQMERVGLRYFPSQQTSLLLGFGLLVGLRHPVRRRIYDHLRLLPGDHFRSVARSLHLAIGTARYHLTALVQDGLVYREDHNGRARYYLTGAEADVNRLYARHWEYRDVRERILSALRRMESAQPAKIAKTLGMSRQLVSYHLGQLEEAGFVQRQGTHFGVVRNRR